MYPRECMAATEMRRCTPQLQFLKMRHVLRTVCGGMGEWLCDESKSLKLCQQCVWFHSSCPAACRLIFDVMAQLGETGDVLKFKKLEQRGGDAS